MMEKDMQMSRLDFLLRFPAQPNLVSPVDFLSNLSWGGIKVRPISRILPICFLHRIDLIDSLIDKIVIWFNCYLIKQFLIPLF